MSFYQDISHYYDYIFPTGKEQVNFIREAAGSPPKTLLDIACGTGGYSIELARLGYEVTAADIDPAMVMGLKSKLVNQDFKINCIQAGMLNLEKEIHSRFDLAFCIGNSLVHLDGKAEVQEFFKSVKKLLKKEGKLVIQIINFDRILNKSVKELPVIKNDDIGLVFERYYRYEEHKNKVYFRTVLTVEDKRIENEIPLLPLLSQQAENMLKDAGFRNVKFFADFTGNEFEKDNSFMLVISACAE
jgi:2-polyprenyl-3-methyl-5-hydroxy-6-metoxy-1,4-benzoquinol methylase